MPHTLPVFVRMTRTFMRGGWTTNSIAPSGPGSGSPVMAVRSHSVVVVVSMMRCSDDVHDARGGVWFVDARRRGPVLWKVEGLSVLERSLSDTQRLRGIRQCKLDEPVAIAREATCNLEGGVARPDD